MKKVSPVVRGLNICEMSLVQHFFKPKGTSQRRIEPTGFSSRVAVVPETRIALAFPERRRSEDMCIAFRGNITGSGRRNIAYCRAIGVERGGTGISVCGISIKGRSRCGDGLRFKMAGNGVDQTHLCL